MANDDDNPTMKGETEFRSYPEIVWRQFKKYDFAYASLFVLGFLLFVALVSPILALDVPFYLYVPADVDADQLRGIVPGSIPMERIRGLSFPWFRELFNTLYFDNGIDLFFNFLLFSMPLNVVAWLIFRSQHEADSKRHFKTVRSLFIAASMGIQTVLFFTIFYINFSLQGSVIFLVVMAGLTAGAWLWFANDKDFASEEQYEAYRRIFLLFAVLFHVAAIVGLAVPDLGRASFSYMELSDVEGVQAWFPPLEYAYWGTTMDTHLEMSAAHWLGTDGQGRDVLTRLLYGTRISLTIGLVAQGLATGIGLVMGSIAGYYGGKVDMVILRIIEVFYTFPALFVIMTLTGFIDQPSIFYVMFIIAIVAWTRVARLVRGEFLRLRNEDFVQAAQALGLPRGRIIFRHILPNALGPVLVYIVFGIAGAILFEAIVSFLGVGDMTVPSWGQILRAGDQSRRLVLILAPGVALFITVTCMYLVGEGVQDAMDPKLRE